VLLDGRTRASTHHAVGALTDAEVDQLLTRLAHLAMQRLPITPALLQAAWALRDNVAARDALYVAAAHAVRGRLLTTDDRLVRAVPDLAVRLT
jgi:predicted nucleic acid-binding protein